jgi:tetratricopeptide (TPR) repeat protein
MIDCEKVLARDPGCVPVLWALARAATKGGHTDVALITLEYIRDRNPEKPRAYRHLGHLYQDKGDIAKAIDAWEHVKKNVPNDREAQVRLRDLAAEKTMVDGKYETATQKGSSYRESLKSQKASEELEEEHRIIRTDEDLQRAIERVSQDVEKEPQNKRYVLQLGDLYRRAKDYEKAREYYERAREIDEMDFSIPERLGELRIDQYSEEERTLEEQLKAKPDDEAAKAKLEALRQEKFDFSLKEYERQVKVRPTDANLRMKLGDLLFQAGQYDEAAPHYQKAASDPRLRRRCRKLLGMCLYNNKKYQLAASQFEAAVEGTTAAGREAREIMYYLALTLEKLEDFDKAEQVLRQIFDADMSYKDVQERLDRIMQAKQEKQASSSDGAANSGEQG